MRLKDIILNQDRALKLPRPKKDLPTLIESFASEMEYLKIKHGNLISMYTYGDIDLAQYSFKYPYFVMEYIEGAKDIRKRTLEILYTCYDTKGIKDLTKWIAEKFHNLAKVIHYLHVNDIIHFDIKPSNLLVDQNDKPVLSDLGFAKKKYDDSNPVIIGFTLYYAHPDLRLDYAQMSSKNRVKKGIPPKDFKTKWDIYAFGKSLLEILSLIDSKFPDIVVYDYNFTYLHLAACRMLDGRNLSNAEIERVRSSLAQNKEELSIYKETWLELQANDFESIKYATFKEIYIDFEKVIMGTNFLDEIPELNPNYPSRIQSSDGIPAPFSKRVKYIAEHPVFTRLMHVQQLGLTNYIYPTATHNRLEYSIGTFRNCCLYIQALYNDPYSPLFKQLISEDDIKSVLVASLVHDLGQYPLAHEIEESVRELNHEDMTIRFLNNSATDRFGNSIKDIIENDDWGWGVKLERVIEIIKGDKQRGPMFKNIRTMMLNSVINGPIDVDKLDYLLRDSQNCFLKYGQLLDIDRLIRNLTIIITKNNTGENVLILGTYEKGQSAAESLAFARYLLYQSLYWHHTSRAIRAMLRETVKQAIVRKIGKKKSFYQEFEEILGIEGEPQAINIGKVLDLIYKWTDEEGKLIIECIKERRIYKRIYTIHNYPQGIGKTHTLERFRKAYKMQGFQERLQDKIRTKFENYVTNVDRQMTSVLAPERTNKVIDLLSTPKKILCDCPEPVYGASNDLRFCPEPQRLQGNYYTRVSIGERISEVWNQVYYSLMNIASKGRIFCHPDIRDTLMATLSAENIRECLEETIREHE